ncbi:MAG: hypothetical protein ACKOXO_08035 [Cyanobium sp.]
MDNNGNGVIARPGNTPRPDGDAAGKLSGVPQTLPLSVTGPGAGSLPTTGAARVRRLLLGLLLIWAPAGAAPAQEATAAPSPAAALRAQAIAGEAPPAAAPPTGTAPAATPPLSDEAFQTLMREGTLDQLDPLCRRLVAADEPQRLRQLRERLLALYPAPQPLAVLLANAEVLLSCRMPEAALTVLERIGPAPGAERVQWLTLQWRAANAALDHRRAALALQRLAGDQPARLEGLQLPLGRQPDGRVVSRSALDLLADHLEAEGRSEAAARLLLQSNRRDAAAAARLARAVRLLTALPPEQREPLFERALEQAAATGSWGLVGDLLALQATLPATAETAARTAERWRRLSRRLDDAYGEWKALQGDPSAAARRRRLEQQLRSPQAAGGHAERLPPLPSQPAIPPVPPTSPLTPAPGFSAAPTP